MKFVEANNDCDAFLFEGTNPFPTALLVRGKMQNHVWDMCVLIIGSESRSQKPAEINDDLLNPYFLSGATY